MPNEIEDRDNAQSGTVQGPQTAGQTTAMPENGEVVEADRSRMNGEEHQSATEQTKAVKK